ncbi:YchJ family protein [Tenacibaculum maritimum]|uniref:YchJ family protein n=1 Tax=Tenacibaculum maritimum TaxID=107401 RepID=UPI001F380996|nr:YchJ family metal-binding protein [Tenacibaculum maritimum]
MMLCLCNSSKTYSNCCKKAHDNIFTVATAISLMRSRYTAFALGNIEYLQKSHHSSTRPSKREKEEILQWTKTVQWLKLELLNTTQGDINSDKGTVEFKAFFIENGILDCIHENSVFYKENKHWVYHSAY